MKRGVGIEEISDGRFYGNNDMVKVPGNECAGCSECCRTMCNTIILDPLDIHLLKTNLGMSFEELMNGYIELNVVDGVILPNIKSRGEGVGCSFLNDDGRCAVHAFRPGICRLFPLGRYYNNGGFQYILQVNECDYELKTKVKIKKWLGIQNLDVYEKFVLDWHRYLIKTAEEAAGVESDAEKEMLMKLLQDFYIRDFEEEFFAEAERLLQ